MKPIFILVLLVTSPAYAAEEVMKACMTLQAVSMSAIENKGKGRGESEMRESIPPLEEIKSDTPPPVAEFVTSMHEILDEIYAFPELNPEIYSIYRMERCFRRMTDQDVPTNFEEVAAKLEACAANDEGQVECAMQAAGSQPSQP